MRTYSVKSEAIEDIRSLGVFRVTEYLNDSPTESFLVSENYIDIYHRVYHSQGARQIHV